MRALVVENDPAVHAALETALREFSDCEHVSDRIDTLTSLENALAADRPFDLVVIDMEAPDMQDGSIIAEIRRIERNHEVPQEKKARLMVISASSKRQLLTDCMFMGCDEFIDKPASPELIYEKLVQLNLTVNPRQPDNRPSTPVTGRQLYEKVIKKIDRGDLDIPPAPKIAMRTRQLVDLNADIEDVVRLLKHDLSISTKLISISNSVAYGGYEKNTSTSQAVRRLGIDRSVDVVMSICCRSYFVTNHPAYKKLVEDLWWHSLACAHTTEMVTRHKKMEVDEDLFSLGLLHDIGKLILIKAASNVQMPRKSGMDFALESLQSIFTEYHVQVGTRTLLKWGYSRSFSALIQHRRTSQDATAAVAMQVLHHADLLATAAGFGYGLTNPIDTSEALEQLGYVSQLQDDFINRIRSQMEQLRYAFG